MAINTHAELLYTIRSHCTYDHKYPNWEALTMNSAIDINAFLYECNIRINLARNYIDAVPFKEEQDREWEFIDVVCQVKDYVMAHEREMSIEFNS